MPTLGLNKEMLTRFSVYRDEFNMSASWVLFILSDYVEPAPQARRLGE